MGDWDEKEHPRNPDDGKFVDKTGTGGWAGKLAAQIGQGRGHTGAGQVTPEQQQRREDALDALNPEAAHRREYMKLFQDIGYDVATARQAVDYHMEYATGLTAPVTDVDRDLMLSSELSAGDMDTARYLYEQLEQHIPDWRFRFPGTAEQVDEYVLDLDDEE